MITLIIVDCQNDFITGSMSVKGAKNVLNEIKNFIKKHCKEIDKIIFTVDWHPYNHMSFKKYGGTYSSHCVQFTPGACIEPKLLKYIQSLNINYEVDTKGVIEEVEELGAFSDIELIIDELGKRYYFDSIVSANADSKFIICGMSKGVKSTIENLLNEEIVPNIFMPGILYKEDLNKFIENNKVELYD